MSDMTNPATPTNADVKPDKPKRTRNTSARIDWTHFINAYAKAHRTDPNAKGLRRTMRTRWADLIKSDPKAYGPKGAKRATNDHTPWPPALKSVIVKTFADDKSFVNELKKAGFGKKS